MTMTSILYISTSAMDADSAERQVNTIVDIARERNPFFELTGALLFTGVHFAQVLEGHDEDIDEMLQSIKRDPRHREIMVMDRSPLVNRRFKDWSMAYSGPSAFVSGFVTRLLNARSTPEHDLSAKWLGGSHGQVCRHRSLVLKEEP